MNKLITYVCLMSILLLGVASAEAADDGLTTSRKLLQFKGKITNISGHTITIRDSNGTVKQLLIDSEVGIKEGMDAICERDCERTIRVGDKIINVQRVLPPPELGGGRAPN